MPQSLYSALMRPAPLPPRSGAGARGGDRLPRPLRAGHRPSSPAARRRRAAGAGPARHALPQPRRARRGLRQARPRRARLARAGVRVRGGRDDHPSRAAREPAAARLPAARGPGARQPARLQQRRGRGRRGGTRPLALARAAGAGAARREPGQVEGDGGRGRARRLRPLARAALELRGLRDDQRQLAQHAGPAGPPGGGAARARSSTRSTTSPPARWPGAAGAPPPVLVKIAPDLAPEQVDAVVDLAMARGIAGMIVSNTTLSREGLASPPELAGAGGRPLGRAPPRAGHGARRAGRPALPGAPRGRGGRGRLHGRRRVGQARGRGLARAGLHGLRLRRAGHGARDRRRPAGPDGPGGRAPRLRDRGERAPAAHGRLRAAEPTPRSRGRPCSSSTIWPSSS